MIGMAFGKPHPTGGREPLSSDLSQMPVSSSFRTFIVDQLSRVVPRVRARSMFGGVGIYAGELFFALIADDTLYFKVDESNRADFEARRMVPFRPHGDSGATLTHAPRELHPWPGLIEDIRPRRALVGHSPAVLEGPGATATNRC